MTSAPTDGFAREDLTPEQIAEESALYGPFTDAVRDLVDATVRTLVAPEEVRAARAEIEAITARLRARELPGSFGVRYGDSGRGRAWGNAAVGLRNPVAPPLEVVADPEGGGKVSCDFRLGAAYEGPPTLVHGGVIALLLDQMLGEAVGSLGRPGMTGTLTIRYRRPTPLGDLRAEAWVDRVDGIKTWAKGHVVGPDGVTAEAEGVFILPRWARELVARRTPPRFD